MKYIRFAASAFLSASLLIAGCGSSTPAAPAKQAQEQSAKAENETEKQARLGDTLDAWSAAYGTPAGDTAYMKSFKDGAVTVIVFENHIVNITLSNPLHKADAPSYKNMIPTDSILVDSRNESDEKGNYKTEMYTSVSLGKAFPLSEGKFAAVTAMSKTDGKHLATIIDCTPLSQ